MANIPFNYFHRDGGNYKKYGSVVFANKGEIDFAEFDRLIRSRLIGQTWFHKLPGLFQQRPSPLRMSLNAVPNVPKTIF